MKIPKNEHRDFYTFNLKNNIPVVYIKDKNLEKPLFYLAVKAGYFNDPDDREGLAHFLEHLMFMGSKKYPKENHFNEELAKFHGSTNAYTDTNKTVYYFSCMESGFENILDIFYHLVKEPLLSESSLDREVNAVNSEHDKNILNDTWRLFHIMGLISDDDHVGRKFGTGNLETLKKDDTIEKVRKFYNKYYHKNNFYICLGDKKEKSYYEKLLNNNFGSLTSEKDQNSYNLEIPYTKNINKKYLLESENNNRKLYLLWNIEKIDQKENPIRLINEITSNMRVNSLQKKLNDLHYIKSLSLSEVQNEDYFIAISLEYSLTDKGIKNINNIIDITKKYFEFLEKQNVNKLIKEFQIKNDIFFDYDENMDSFSVSSEIIETMMESNEILYYYNNSENLTQGIFQKIVNVLRGPNIQMLLLPKEKLVDSIEKLEEFSDNYYKMKYYKVNINQDIKKNNIEFELQIPNKYVKTPVLQNKKETGMIKKGLNYYKFNKSWNTPNVYLTIIIDFPHFEDNYLQIMQGLLVLSYQIREYYYDAMLLGYGIKLTPIVTKNILILDITGYNTDIDFLLEDFMSNIKNLGNLEKYLNIVNKEYKHDLEKYKTSPPLSYGFNEIKKILLENYKTSKDLLDEYRDLSAREYFNILSKIVDNKKKIYQYGNYKNIIDYTDTFDIKVKNNRELINTEFKHPNPKEENKGLFIIYKIGQYNIKNDTFATLLNSIMADKFFDELRTKNQVGYLVGQGINNLNGCLYLVQRIQTQKDLNKVIKLVNNFNSEFKLELERLDSEDFNNYKNSMKKKLLKPYESITDEYNFDINEILTNKFVFNRKELMVKELDNINKNVLLKFMSSFINKGKIIKIN